MTENKLKNAGGRIVRSGDLAQLSDFISQHPHLVTHLLREAVLPEPNTHQLVEFLLAAGGDPNELGRKGDNALHNAATYNNVESARILIAAGAHIDAPGAFHFNGGTPLACAAGFGYPRVQCHFLKGELPSEFLF